MIQDITYHGRITPEVEFYATVLGPRVTRRFYMEEMHDSRGTLVRFFGPGNELALDREGIRVAGNGGTVSTYMFGAHLPVADLLAEDVVNRLVLNGARLHETTGELVFTTRTANFLPYAEVFLQGNAIANCFFFIQDDGHGTVVERQAQTLRTLGKLLKRSPLVGVGDLVALTHEMAEALFEPESTVFLVNLVQRLHRIFYERCRVLYAEKRGYEPADVEDLDLLASELAIDRYQAERIKIDVIYQHPENRTILAEYKQILARCAEESIRPSERARLMRLRTMSVRNNIPPLIFDTLEELVLRGRAHLEVVEPDFIRTTREIIEGFHLPSHGRPRLTVDEIVGLLDSKMKSMEARDQGFEEILLDAGRLLDERAAQAESEPEQEKAIEALESFGELVTIFDRFTATATLINKMAFMDDVELSEANIRSLASNRLIFDGLTPGFFNRLFVVSVLANPYVLNYGRKKLIAAVSGLDRIAAHEATLAELAARIHEIHVEEVQFRDIYRICQRRLKAFYSELHTAEGKSAFTREALKEYQRTTGEIRRVEPALLESVVQTIRLEAYYLQNLLPAILENRDLAQREEFLANSGLDRFLIEELEQEYVEGEALSGDALRAIRGS